MSDSLGDTLASPVRGAEVARLQRGDLVSRYVVVRELGQGGMSVVYLAYDPELDRRVALKMLKRQLSDYFGPDAPAQVLREGQAMARLSHPNVVHVHDVGTHEGALFLAMEFVDGETLTDWLLGERRTTEEIVTRFIHAGQGLLAAHAVGLIHRDFKPDNVLIGKDGRVRVSDFGLVRALKHPEPVEELPGVTVAAAKHSQPGSVAGTPAYMSPEQRRGEVLDASTDQFSFCVALCEALTGRPPSDGESFATLPRWLQPVMTKGLAANRAERYPSMQPLLDALTDGLRPRRRRRWMVAGVGVAVAAVTLGAYALRAPVRAGCEKPDERLDGIWGPAQSAQLKDVFAKSGAPGAEDVAALTASALDGFARAFKTSWRASCAAHEAVTSPQERELVTLSVLCLDVQREELRALVSDLSSADANLVQHAVDAARGLPVPAACVDDRRLEANRKLLAGRSADDPQSQSLRMQLARLRVQIREGALKQVRPAVVALVDAARAHGDRLVLLEALLAQGELFSELWVSAEAEGALHEAFQLAMALGQDDLGAQSAINLVYVLGTEQSRPAEGKQWAAVSHAVLARAGNPPSLEARLWHIEGVLLIQAGDNEGAVRALNKALELRGVVDPQGASYASTLFSLARAEEYLGQLGAAVKHVEQAQQLMGKTLGKGSLRYATTFSGMARVSALTGDASRAERLSAEGLRLVIENSGLDAPVAADMRQMHAESLALLGRYAEANTEAELARQRFVALGRGSMAAYADVVSCKTLWELARPLEAEAACSRAVSAITNEKDIDPVEVAEIREQMAYLLLQMGRVEDSGAEFQRALDLRQSQQGAPELPARAGLALCALKRHEPEKALQLLGPPRAPGAIPIFWRFQALLAAGLATQELKQPGAEALLDEAAALLSTDSAAFPELRVQLLQARGGTMQHTTANKTRP